MPIIMIPKGLRMVLKDEGTEGFKDALHQMEHTISASTLRQYDDKFERRLSQFALEFRQSMQELELRINERINEVEVRLNKRIDELRSEMIEKIASVKSDIIKWMFIFWVGQTATVIAIIKFL